MKNMTEVGIRALKQNASAVVAQVEAGAVITITDRGRPVAQMSPIPTSRLDGLIESGLARSARRSIRDLPSRRSGPSLSEALIAMRDEERF
jgi:prevent-host-death family protein